MSIDLHIHSTQSDGSMTPEELVHLAAKKGLSAIAITDHDTMAGVLPAQEAGRAAGVEVISGLELSVKHGQWNLHLLGYFCHPENSLLASGLRRLQEGRVVRNRCILGKLEVQGIAITEREMTTVAGPGLCGRPHIARVLMARGVVRSMDEAFDRYLASSGSAYCQRLMFAATEAIELIHQAGGLAILAHPGQVSQQPEVLEKLLGELLPAGLDGIELYYPSHSTRFKRNLLAYAEQHNLLATGGSDYHGSIRPGTSLAGGKGMRVPELVLEKMKERLDVLSLPAGRR